MTRRRLSLGLDSSTQSLSAVIVDADKGAVVFEHSLSYRDDPRLNFFGLDARIMIVPPREPGEADQPPALFLASLDALFADLASRKEFSLSEIVSIDISAQQHGHVYLGAQAAKAFATLGSEGAAKGSLVDLLGGVFSYGTAPIWKTANTEIDADAIRKGVGGSKAMIEASGSDSPLRFSGAVVRRVGRQFPELYRSTWRVPLISNFIAGLLLGNADVPTDFGNAAGTSLMNYAKKTWDPRLLKAASGVGAGLPEGLPGGSSALSDKLSKIVSPLAVGGKIARYYTDKYGFDPACAVLVGSGDNPQTKVLFEGDLLSLGTSFVMMVSTDGSVDPNGYANAMYDGLGRPFCFGCRTNGALVWDRVAELHGVPAKDFARRESALASEAPGSRLRIWQPDRESFPDSEITPLTRIGDDTTDFASDYSGLVDSTLGFVWLYSRGFASAQPKALYLSGGPTASKGIVDRVAAIWNCPVIVIGRSGAALGAAVAAAVAMEPEAGRDAVLNRLRTTILGASQAVLPKKELVSAYHEGGYLERLKKAFPIKTR